MFLDFWYLYFPCKKLILTEGGSGSIFVHWQLKFSFWHSSSFLQWWMGPGNDREKIGTTTKICLFGCRICIWRGGRGPMRRRKLSKNTWNATAYSMATRWRFMIDKILDCVWHQYFPARHVVILTNWLKDKQMTRKTRQMDRRTDRRTDWNTSKTFPTLMKSDSAAMMVKNVSA